MTRCSFSAPAIRCSGVVPRGLIIGTSDVSAASIRLSLPAWASQSYSDMNILIN